MRQTDFRKLSDVEFEILKTMTQLAIPCVSDLVNQISAATVRTIDEFGSSSLT